MKARCGSQNEPAAPVEVGGRGGAVCVARSATGSVATPGQFGGSSPASKPWAQDRMVWREMPVRRSISRWLLPALSSVQMVVCKCGFKTFTSFSPPRVQGGESYVPLVRAEAPDTLFSVLQFTPARWSVLETGERGHRLSPDVVGSAPVGHFLREERQQQAEAPSPATR